MDLFSILMTSLVVTAGVPAHVRAAPDTLPAVTTTVMAVIPTEMNGLALYQVRDGVLFPEGAAILNGGFHAVVNIGEAGELRGTVGREGGGPGEFRYPQWLARAPGDSVAVYDNPLRRITFIGADSRVGRTLRLPAALDGWLAVGMFADGRLLLRTSSRAREATRRGVVQDTFAFRVLDPADGALTEVHRGPGTIRYVDLTEGPGGSMNVMVMPVPFAGEPLVGVEGGRFVYVSPGSCRIDVFDAGRGTTLNRTLPLERRRVTGRDRSRYMEAQAARAESEEGRRAILARLEGLPFAEVMPCVTAARVDPAGRVWVGRKWLPGEPETWWVLDRENLEPVATLILRPNESLLRVGSDRMLVVHTDELDVESVQLRAFRLP